MHNAFYLNPLKTLFGSIGELLPSYLLIYPYFRRFIRE